MHNRLKDLDDMALYEDEVVGPELIGTVEYEKDGHHSFHGGIIPTTHRLFIKLRQGEEIETHAVEYKDITGITTENLLLVGNIIHIWIGSEIVISMKSVSDGKLDKFLDFIYRYRAKRLKLDEEISVNQEENAV
ncbi:PH domain-containing protein [Salinicoccus sp. CNSTN-B1]